MTTHGRELIVGASLAVLAILAGVVATVWLTGEWSTRSPAEPSATAVTPTETVKTVGLTPTETVETTGSLAIYPDSNITYGSGTTTLNLHVKNVGPGPVVIYKVEIVDVGSTSLIPAVTVLPGDATVLRFNILGNVTVGRVYLVKVYTRTGEIYVATVKAVE